MTAAVLLDTSFLISLVDGKRPNHSIAVQYYRMMLEQQSPMYFSAIVAAEFAIKQPITDLPLKNFRCIPFNITHSTQSARLWNLLVRDSGDNRAVVRDDIKLMAQAAHESIPFILTEDASTLYKYCERLRDTGALRVRAIRLVDGFDSCALREDGQRGLSLDQSATDAE
ncbi:MAG: PIN domain-containing protein [Sulfuricella sp.]